MSLLWLCLGLVSASTESRVFDLPSMTMMLSVRKVNKDEALFQDRLSSALHDHLKVFFLDKLISIGYGSTVSIDHIGLSSAYGWKEISEDPDEDLLRHFEVEGNYDCQVKLTLEPTEDQVSHLTQSQMDLFFIEAFQQGNYWLLVHKFLSDEVLQGVNDVKITVHSDGFVPIGRADPTADDFKEENMWTSAIKTGIFFAGFFCLALVCLWIYMFFYVQRSKRNQEKESRSVASITDEDSADHDYVVNDVEHNGVRGNIDDDSSTGSWMDSWASKMTSIPLRETGRKRSPKSRKNRPQQQVLLHNPSLDCIREGADEDASVSSFKSRASRVSRTKSSERETSEEEASLASYNCINMSLNQVSWLTNIEEETSEPVFPDVLPAVTKKAHGRLPVKDSSAAARKRDPKGLAAF